MTLTERRVFGRLRERRAVCCADCHPRDHAAPFEEAVRGDNAHLELSVVRPRVLERLDPAEELADVAEQDAARFAAYQLTPSTLTSAANGFERRFSDPVQTYAARPNRSFKPPSPASRIIAASKPAPAMTAKRSPLKRPTSSLRRSPLRPISTALSMSFGIPKLVAKRFAVPAGRIPRADLGARQHIDAALHHPIAAPGEDKLGALLDCSAHLLGRFPALWHLAPKRLVDSFGRERPSERRQSTVKRLARMSDHGDLHRRSPPFREAAADAAAVRHAKTRTPTAATPTTRPPPTSSGWCIPRYMREVATNATIQYRNAQTTMRKALFVNLDVSK